MKDQELDSVGVMLLDYFVDILMLVEFYHSDHSVDSTDLTAQCSRFLFLSVHGPKISTALERIAQIYLPFYLSLTKTRVQYQCECLHVCLVQFV